MYNLQILNLKRSSTVPRTPLKSVRHPASCFGQGGQSLLELLIAIFILVTVFTATVVLMVTSINASRESRNKLVATSLAREGIELVRNIRDSNWADPDQPAWDVGLDGTNPAYPKILETDPPTPQILEFNIPLDDLKMQVRLSNGRYVQGDSVGNGTQFYRYIYANPICRDNSSPPVEQIVEKNVNQDCQARFGANYSKVGIRIVVEVHWPKVDSSRKVMIEDRLYNWQML